MSYWFDEVKASTEPDIVTILVGTQLDLESERQVSLEDALFFQQIRKIDYFIETSAKTGENAIKTFTAAAMILFKRNLQRIS